MHRRFLFFILLFLALLGSSYAQAADLSDREFRGVWVSTVYQLDYPATATTDPATLRKNADEILDRVQTMGLTDVVLQVRPCADALYPSALFPWSRFLTGTQGTAPADGFDPLAYWVEAAHKRHLFLHGWINPFRVTIGGSSEISGLSAKNPAVLHPEFVVNYKENLYFDPGLPAVRQLIADGVAELVKNYDLDGIQLDDYFYPGTDFPDSASYQAYGGSFADLTHWRQDNINQLIQLLDNTIHQSKPDVLFGISPAGIWCNDTTDRRGSHTAGSETLTTAYADSYTWVKQGWVDYICPQIYWERGHSQADYQTLVSWWADTVKDTPVSLIIGMAAYKAQQAQPDSPWYGTKELMGQLADNRKISGLSGVCFFRYGSLLTVDGLADALTVFYQTPFTPEQSDSLPEVTAPETKPAAPFWRQKILWLFHTFWTWLKHVIT
jgi:uncharacterized lipoprotein YddW (UPF0748 family)